MILLCGIPSETPLAMVARALDASSSDYVVLNQHRVGQCSLELEIVDGRVDGDLCVEGAHYRLADFTAAYFRLMDDRLLPELEGEPETSPKRRHARAFHDVLYRWLEVAPGRIVNRIDPQGSNGSKPYQAQLIVKHGLQVPETLITDDPELVLAFQREHGTLIYKSISGVRSIVKTLDDDDLSRLERVRACPVQFQALVPGIDVRAHVIGEEVYATEIRSDRADYRYARRQGGTTELRAIELSQDIEETCVSLAHDLGLAFAGIDLRLTPEGSTYCFEVNPCTAFSFYEANTGQPIADAVARYLDGAAAVRATPALHSRAVTLSTGHP